MTKALQLNDILFTAPWAPAFMTPWALAFTAPWALAFTAPWAPAFMAPWAPAFMATWASFHSSLISLTYRQVPVLKKFVTL